MHKIEEKNGHITKGNNKLTHAEPLNIATLPAGVVSFPPTVRFRWILLKNVILNYYVKKNKKSKKNKKH